MRKNEVEKYDVVPEDIYEYIGELLEYIEGTFVNHIFRYGFTTIEDKYVCSKCAGRTAMSSLLYQYGWSSMISDQAMDMLSGFLFGLGFGIIIGHYLI